MNSAEHGQVLKATLGFAPFRFASTRRAPFSSAPHSFASTWPLPEELPVGVHGQVSD